jgi:hypothetical protein
MSDFRLTALPAYRALSGHHQSFARLVLIDGLSPNRACAVLGLTNPTRLWNSVKVQALRAAYGDPDTAQDWIERLKAAQVPDRPAVLIPQKPAQITVQNAPRCPETRPETPASPGIPPNCPVAAQPANPDPDRCPACRLVLCGCSRGEVPPNQVILGGPAGVDPSDLFPDALTPLNGAKGGPCTADLWREQDRRDRDERRRLIAEIERQQQQQHWY